MGSDFFIDRKLKKQIEKDIKKRNVIEERINKLKEELENVNSDIEDDLEEFYRQTDNSTVLSTLKYYEENGSKKKQNLVKELRENYQNSNLLIEDTLTLTDWYEKMCDEHYKDIKRLIL